MQLNLDPLILVNLILCIVILVFGIISWQRKKSQIALLVGIAFGLFGLSHLATLLGLNTSLSAVLIVIRTLAYLLVAYAMFLAAYSEK